MQPDSPVCACCLLLRGAGQGFHVSLLLKLTGDGWRKCSWRGKRFSLASEGAFIDEYVMRTTCWADFERVGIRIKWRKVYRKAYKKAKKLLPFKAVLLQHSGIHQHITVRTGRDSSSAVMRQEYTERTGGGVTMRIYEDKLRRGWRGKRLWERRCNPIEIYDGQGVWYIVHARRG